MPTWPTTAGWATTRSSPTAPPWPATWTSPTTSTIGAFSAVHQFCRVGVYGFLGGYTVATKDVLPYSKTVGNRARIYGVNTLGLQRRGFTPEVIAAIRHAYRVLLQSRLNTSEALARLESEPMIPEVRAAGRLHPLGQARRGPQARQPAAHVGRGVSGRHPRGGPGAAGADRGQRPVSLPGGRRRPPRGPPRGRGRHQGRGGPRPGRRRGRDPLGLARPARPLHRRPQGAAGCARR